MEKSGWVKKKEPAGTAQWRIDEFWQRKERRQLQVMEKTKTKQN